MFKALLSGVLAACAMTGAGSVATAQTPPPLEAFSIYAAMQNVALSPDGEHIAFMRLPARDARYFIEVYKIDELDGEPYRRLGSDRMDITGFNWVGNDHIWVNFIEQVRDRIEGTNQGVFASKRAIAEVSSAQFTAMPDDAALVSSLRTEPNEILIFTSNVNQNDDLEGRSREAAFARDFVRYNLRNRRQRMVLRGNTRLGGYRFDADANPRFASEVNRGSREVIYFSRGAGDNDTWNEFLRFPVDAYDQ